MSQQHTPGPWISEGSFIGIPNGKGTFYMVPLSGINQDRREADARRIVACVNACAGISTDSLEQEGSAVMGWMRTARKLVDASKQLDELLEALECIAHVAYSEFQTAEGVAKAAIASVKCGAA